jgi:hypothetical protein
MASAAPHEAAETSKKLNEEPALLPPQSRKEYHHIEDSLINPAILPGAPWGFVLVRTVYGAASDAPWARMLEHLRSEVAHSLVLADQTDLLPRHELTIIEDEATLSDADSHTVRRVFCNWVAEDITPRLCDAEKMGGTAQIRAKLISNTLEGVAHRLPSRWNFCIFVDEDCLRSLDAKFPAVKILARNWEKEEEEESEDEDEDQEDIGWMYMDGAMLPSYVGMYSLFTDLYAWHDFYQRPSKGYVD